MSDYFLFFIGGLWILFATVQDLRTREVSNWLNFSLIGFALAYRAFYSSFSGNWNYLLYGIAGFAIFFVLAYAFYYGKLFAGGDAKLLMGLGVILPYSRWEDLIWISLMYISLLLLCGALYGIIYSLFLVYMNFKNFRVEFGLKFRKWKYFLILSFVIAIPILFINSSLKIFAFLFVFIFPLLWMYGLSLDKCMVRLYSPFKLTEGDWLERDVKIGNRVIKKSVHGLSMETINILRKHNKSVYVKEGIPFVPAFAISFVFMVLFYSTLLHQMKMIFSALF